MNKYNNKKTVVDDIPFDSMLEARAYKYLRDNANYLIYELQPEFELQAKFKYRGKTVRAIKYIADFMVAYKGRFYVVDAKGMETPAFKIKLKMLYYTCPAVNFVLFKSIKQFENDMEKIHNSLEKLDK